MSPSFHIIIPARLNSSRLPQKLLLEVGGKTIIEHVYQQCLKVSAQSIVIATDSLIILEKVKSFGADAILTSEKHPSGTDRIAEAARILGLADDEIIVNIQGDEPQMQPQSILQVASLLAVSKSDWASLYWPIESLKDFVNPNVVKVVMDDKERALYFSRSPIPFNRQIEHVLPVSFRHIGLYAYQMQSLQKWVQASQAKIEQYECLEQLRALYLGMKIQMAKALIKPGQDINTIEDFNKFSSTF
jgi:3-deoxy-manno-octulosonate cytidylyltransferase (CMP-KDO synthetase)